MDLAGRKMFCSLARIVCIVASQKPAPDAAVCLVESGKKVKSRFFSVVFLLKSPIQHRDTRWFNHVMIFRRLTFLIRIIVIVISRFRNPLQGETDNTTIDHLFAFGHVIDGIWEIGLKER